MLIGSVPYGILQTTYRSLHAGCGHAGRATPEATGAGSRARQARHWTDFSETDARDRDVQPLQARTPHTGAAAARKGCAGARARS